MIVLNFKKWHDAHLEKYSYYRIYRKGWKWTPFVKRIERLKVPPGGIKNSTKSW